MATPAFRFGDFEVDVEQFQVRQAGAPVHVEPQVYDVIAHLVANRHRVVTKEEMLDAVWGDRFVSESTLSTRINMARKALGDDGRRQAVIKTVFGRGFQFVAEGVDDDGPDEDSPGASQPPTPRTRDVIRFVETDDGARLGYATSGDGPVLLKAANWMTHLEFDRESPIWRHWIDDLSTRCSLIRYDERGCGLSDWDVDDFTFDTWVRDLHTLADHLELERFPLLGISQGAAVAIAFAAQFPERVSGLLLVGAYPRGRLVRATTEDELRQAALDVELARAGWGIPDSPFMQVFASQFMPDADRSQWNAFNDLQAKTTSPDNAVSFLETFAHIDVSGFAPKVECPTLLVHSRDELRVPAANAWEIASLIPDAELVSLPSRNHILQADEPAWDRFLSVVDEFLATVAPS